MITPPFLKPGDKVAIVGTAKIVLPAELQTCIQTLESWGLQPVLGTHVYEFHYQFASTDEHRISDLQNAMDDPGIRCILFARGGYGTLRILDRVDFTGMKKNPKWLIGFSDLTPLLMRCHQEGIRCIHGPMGTTFLSNMGDEQSIAHLKKILFQGGDFRYQYQSSFQDLQRKGTAKGELIGGCLSLLSNVMGTPTDFETKNRILFIEDIDEYLYHLDRLCIHLKRGGKFENPAAVITGGLTGMKDNESPFGKLPEEIVAEALKEYSYPTCFGFPTGHWPKNYPMVIGAMATLEISGDEVSLGFQV